METLNLVLFAALMISFLVLFLAPGRWWPRRPPRERRDDAIPHELLPPHRRQNPEDWN